MRQELSTTVWLQQYHEKGESRLVRHNRNKTQISLQEGIYSIPLPQGWVADGHAGSITLRDRRDTIRVKASTELIVNVDWRKPGTVMWKSQSFRCENTDATINKVREVIARRIKKKANPLQKESV